MSNSQGLKIALVHDFLTQYGGAERVLEVFAEMFPTAPIYTLLYDEERMRGKFADRKIHASFLQKFPRFLRKRYKWLLPFFPIAPETFDLRDFDLVISSSGAWSKGIVTRLNTVHIAYIHSPMRFVWDKNEEYLGQQRKNFLTKFFIRKLLNYIRIWDKVAADRPDYIIANSKYTQKRIKKYYGRDSEVIYPPIEIKSQIPNYKSQTLPTGRQVNHNNQNLNIKTEDEVTSYFLVVSRLSPYKKIDAVVEAFNKLELPLVIAGEGSDEQYLRKIAGDNIKIMGWQSDKEVSRLYSGARALVFPAEDDFGLTPVEAMGHGVPVLAIRKGGVLETVIEGKTGEFFDATTPEVIADGVRRFMEKEKEYDREFIVSRAKEFSRERFKGEFFDFISKVIEDTRYKLQ